ncbi:hypothetical protein EV44_g3665 [Erysiphe necator]|uniref:Uncharacterized protein n=1 Tax=Uncinula necator TaxID=52586 RepID=A0A0B1P1W1_UNCNE|nr:hypothetical protein EV44_g3665 [Erysiphe necator]
MEVNSITYITLDLDGHLTSKLWLAKVWQQKFRNVARPKVTSAMAMAMASLIKEIPFCKVPLEDINKVLRSKPYTSLKEARERLPELIRDYTHLFTDDKNNGNTDALLQDFWNFTMDEETDVDIFAHGLTKIQSNIALVDPGQRPSGTIRKNRLLNHFNQIKDGRYSGCVSSLRLNAQLSFEDCVNSLRSTQGNIKRFEVKIEPSIMLARGPDSPRLKVCAHCKKGHIRESCFIWIDTPDGSKWAAKNPGKASNVLKRKNMLTKKRLEVNDEKDRSGSAFDGVWMMGDNSSPTKSDLSSSVVLDTGATHHIFCDQSAFLSLSPI